MKTSTALRSKALWIPLAVIALLYLFAWLGLPRLVQWQAQKQVMEKSAHVLMMDTPQLNPLTWTLRIPRLSLSSPQGETLVKFQELFVDLSGTDLLTGLVAFDQIDLKNLELQVALLPEGQHNFTALIEAFKPEEPEDESQEPPALLLSHLLISNAVVDFQDRRTQNGLKTRFEPLNLELRDLSTRTGRNGEFQLDARTGLDAELKLRAQVQAAEPAATGEFTLKGLNLDKLQPVLKPLLPTGTPQGTADLALNFDVKLNSSQDNAQPQVLLTNIQAEVRDFRILAKAQEASPSAGFASLAFNNGLFSLQENKVELANLTLTDARISHASKAQAVGLRQLELGSLLIDLKARHAEVASVHLTGGQVNVTRNAQGNIDLMTLASAWMPAPAPAPDTTQSAWTYAIQQVKISGVQAQIEDQGLKPSLALGLTDIRLETGKLTEQLDRDLDLKAGFSLASGGTVSVEGKLNPVSPTAQLKLDVNGLALKVAQPFVSEFARLELVSGLLSTQGTAVYSDREQSYKGSVAVAGLRLNETGSAKPFLQFNRLSTASLAASQKGVNIQRLTLDGLDTALLIARDKSSNISRILKTRGPAAPPSATPAPAASSVPAADQFQVNIERFNLVNGELDFADESLFIPFGTRIHGLQGVVNGLSTRPGARGELALKGAVDEFGEAEAQGRLNLLDPTAYMDIAVNFNNVEMRSLTPYSGTFANRKIESGKLSMKLVYNIENQQLNSSNQVTIDKLTLGERVQSPQGRDLPLELAIAILEDSNGRIDLGLPISGNLNDPEFSYGAIVWKAIGNVLTKIVSAPFRALGALFAGSQAEDLGQVVFNPGASSLSPPQRESLKKVAEALNTRPNLGLTVQGTWAAADKAAIQNLQMRRAVALQAGEKLASTEDPGPLAVNSPAVQKAIENLFEKRFGGAELEALKTGFRKANPGQLEQGAAGKALSQVTGLFRENRQLDNAEIASLKGKHFHGVLAQRLQNSEEVSNTQLLNLANQRQQGVSAGLLAAGVAAERLKVILPLETKATEDKTVPLGLDVAVRR